MRQASDPAPLPWTVVRGETGEDIIRHFTPEASSSDVALILGYRRRRRARLTADAHSDAYPTSIPGGTFMLRCFMQEYCTDRGKAVALAPQVSDHFAASGRRRITNKAFRNQMAHVYVPVCPGHLDGWWDGSDPGVKRLPAFAISASTIAATARRRRRVAS